MPVALICAYCGKEFKTSPSRVKAGRKFCSAECFYKSYRGRKIWGGSRKCPWISKSNKEKPRVPKNIVKCEICGKEFHAPKHRNRRFCSNKCRAVWSSKWLKGRIKKNAKGRYVSDRGYVKLTISHLPPDEQKLARKMTNAPFIYEHRLIMAKLLGRPLERYEVVHHKDGNRSNNKLENLQLMTLGEHSKNNIVSLNRDGRCPMCGHVDKIKNFLNAWFEEEFG